MLCEQPTILATSRIDSPNDMRQPISKWVRNPDRSPYGKDPPTGKTPIPANFVSRSCSEAYSGFRITHLRKGARGIVEGDSVPDILIPRLVHLCTQGCFSFDRLVQYYSLREINQAAEDAEKGAILKPVLRTELE